MNTPISWIKRHMFLIGCEAQEYADAMTLSGSNVEGYEK